MSLINEQYRAAAAAREALERPMGEPTSVYDALVAAGAEIQSHESDLYVRRTEDNRRILESFDVKFEAFVDSDGQAWFEVPFGYSPFWRARGLTG